MTYLNWVGNTRNLKEAKEVARRELEAREAVERRKRERQEEVAMRRVKYKKTVYVPPTENEKGRWEKEIGEGVFHCWGLDYEEMDIGAVNFTTGIVELDDGTVRNVPAENIQFIDKVQA